VIAFLAGWLSNTPDAAAPYALAALGLIISERAGVLTLTAEGLMLVGGVAAIGCDLSLGGYPLLALAAAMLASAVVSLLFGALVVSLRVNQVIAGLAVVFFCEGLTTLVGTLLDWQNHPVGGMLGVSLPGLTDLPVVGRLLFGQSVVTYLVVPVFFLVDHVLRRTMAGLRLRAVGENPEAADAAGVSVVVTRYLAIMAGAALIGLAGGLLSVGGVKMWFPDMAAGRGWIAIALVIFARWRPWRALLGALLFGGIESLVPRIAAAGIQAPQYFMLMTPYVATLGVMIWTAVARRTGSDGPGALGLAFIREERR
jgi:simple sugar transport system permease protein